MKLDWKFIALTPGYKSLKAAYIVDVNRKYGRPKEELYKQFQWVIALAKHYSSKTGKSVDQVLTSWEVDRTYGWTSFYACHNLPKLHSNCLKPLGVNGIRNYHKTAWFSSSEQEVKHKVCRFIQDQQPRRSKKKRWDMGYKRRMKRHRSP